MPALNPGLTGPFATPLRGAFAPGAKSIMARAISILRRYGQDAHIYLPGVGMLNGLQAANYIDSAGTTQGTVDQPVGLVLDAAGGLGVELVSNGGFDTDSNWTKHANTTIASGVASTTGLPAYASMLTQNINLVAGKSYQYSFNVTKISGSNLTVSYGAYGIRAGVGETGVQSGIFVSQTTGTPPFYVWEQTGGTWVGSIDNISVREVTGIAASQPTTSAKPILRRGAVNLLPYSGDFSNAAWSKGALTLGVNGGLIASTTASSDKTLNQAGLAASASTNYTVCARVKKAAVDWCVISQFNQTSNGARRYFNLATGTVGSGDNFNGGVDASPPTIVDAGDGYWLIALAQTGLAGTTSLSIRIQSALSDLGRTYPASDTTSAQIFVASAALFQGTYTAAQIQALGGIPLTLTAPASTALGAHFWQFDGSNDSLSLGSVPFQMSDDHWVVAVASTNAASIQTLFAQSSAQSTSGPVFGVNAGRSIIYYASGGGTTTSVIGPSLIDISTPFVASALKTGNNVSVRKNGLTGNLGTLSGTYTATTTAAIGNNSRVTATEFLNGNIYPIAFGKGTITDADLLLIEKMLGQLSGVQI